jgi:hypothetical protein
MSAQRPPLTYGSASHDTTERSGLLDGARLHGLCLPRDFRRLPETRQEQCAKAGDPHGDGASETNNERRGANPRTEPHRCKQPSANDRCRSVGFRDPVSHPTTERGTHEPTKNDDEVRGKGRINWRRRNAIANNGPRSEKNYCATHEQADDESGCRTQRSQNASHDHTSSLV